MKILLLGTPRSGTTSLYNLIKIHLDKIGHKSFIEPFNPELYKKYLDGGHDFSTITPFDRYSNLFVKTLYMSNPYDYNNNVFQSNDEYIGWCLSYFDKIIFTERKDKKEQAESFIINEEQSRIYGYSWHIPKIYKPDNIDNDNRLRMIKRFEDSSDDLRKIAIKNNYPIVFYEDLYYDQTHKEMERISDILGIKFENNEIKEWILNRNRRVRIEHVVGKKII
jgi:hypothetical protein